MKGVLASTLQIPLHRRWAAYLVAVVFTVLPES